MTGGRDGFDLTALAPPLSVPAMNLRVAIVKAAGRVVPGVKRGGHIASG